jgi:hypothetical protein
MQEITIKKGVYEITIYASKVVEKLRNRMFIFTPGTGRNNFEAGRKETRLINLLRVTHEININIGYICGTSTKSAKEVKDELKEVFEGASESGTITLEYSGDTYTGFIEDLTFGEYAKDFEDDGDFPEDSVRYELQMNFVVGTI